MYEETLIPHVPDRRAGRPWAAKIVNTPGVDGADVYVRIPGLDGGEAKHGPCRYMMRGAALPTEGDDALVTFDDENTLWIIGWWPYA